MRVGLILWSLFVVVLFACRPAKKVQKIQTAINKSDTTRPVVINPKVDSIDHARFLYGKVEKQKIDFETLSAKVRVEYDGKEGGDEATAFIRLKKDSLIWLSLRGALGIEGFRVLITRDSVKVMNLLKKNIQLRSISFLQEMTKLPFDFKTMQDLIIGNPIFLDSNIVSYKVGADNRLNILMIGKVFKHLVTLDNSSYLLLHSKLDDVDAAKNRTCDITLSNYDYTAGLPFALYRRISVAEHSKLDINLDFKQYSFGQPLTFPFIVPKNFKRQ